MKTDLGNTVTKVLGYISSAISLVCVFGLTCLGIFMKLNIKIEDIIICLVCALIFFISAKIRGKQGA